jgi:Tol biopolymer transport system component
VGFSPSLETAVGTPPLQQGDSSDSQVNTDLVKRHRKAMIGVIAAGVMIAATLTYVLYRALARPPRPSTELTQKRLTFSSSKNPVGSSAISPDGKYLAYSDPAGIHVKLISSGEERVIPKPPGVSPAADWVNQYWFPDSTKLIANAWDPGGRGSIWTVSLLGQPAREIREDATGGAVSPDGMRVAYWGPVAASEELPREIWVMGSEGDNPQKVIALGENEGFGHGVWWPHGQRLAYIRMRKNSEYGPQAVAIETFDLKGATRTVVVSDPSLENFWWFPDQRIVYSRQESPDSNDDNLWQIGIDGRASTPIGKPKRITQWAGSTCLD